MIIASAQSPNFRAKTLTLQRDEERKVDLVRIRDASLVNALVWVDMESWVPGPTSFIDGTRTIYLVDIYIVNSRVQELVINDWVRESTSYRIYVDIKGLIKAFHTERVQLSIQLHGD